MFIWNGISSDDMGIKVITLPPVSKAKQKINETEIDGRDGFLTEINGYEGSVKEVTADYFGNNIEKIISWLDGSGKVVFGNRKDRYYIARINNELPFEKIAKGMYNFSIQFKCQPFGYLFEGEEIIEITEPTTIYNAKNTHKSKPYIKIIGNGDINLFINNKNLVLKNIKDYIEIDSDKMNCYKTINGVVQNQNDKMYSNFPTINIGENKISWIGNISKIEIIPRWCCL